MIWQAKNTASLPLHQLHQIKSEWLHLFSRTFAALSHSRWEQWAVLVIPCFPSRAAHSLCQQHSSALCMSCNYPSEQIPRNPHPQHKPGMSDGGDCTAEFAVDAPAVVEFFVGWPGGALVLDAADAADAHDEDDEHQDEGHAQGPDDDVQGVTRHVC